MLAGLKPYLYAAVAALLLLLGGLVVYKFNSAEIASLKDQNKTLAAQVEAQAALAAGEKARSEKQSAVLTKSKEKSDALAQAVEAHRVWADEPVPDDVARLFNHSDSTP